MLIIDEDVESSNLEHIAYDSDENLTVTFKHGAVWRYANVPLHLARELLEAESKGRLFSDRIKGQYEGERL